MSACKDRNTLPDSASKPEPPELLEALPKRIENMAHEVVDNGIAYDVLDKPAPPNVADDVADLKAKLHAQQQRMLEARRPPSAVALARANEELERFKRYGAIAKVSDDDEPVTGPRRAAKRLPSVEARAKETAPAPRKVVSTWADPKTWLQILTGTALVLVIVRLILTLVPSQPESPPARTTSREVKTPIGASETSMEESGQPLKSVEQSIRQVGIANIGNREFESSLQRLMLAIAAFPDDSFQSLVKRANENHQPLAPLACPFEWNSNGELALILSFRQDGANFVTDGMDRCSAALEKLHHEKTAGSGR